MDQEIEERFKSQDEKLDAIQQSIEKIRKQLFWKTVTNVILFLLPVIGIAALVPWLMDTFTSIIPLP